MQNPNPTTFLDSLRESHLLSDQQVAEVEARLGAQVSLQQVAADLVEQGWLTRYQVKRVLANKGKGLVLGQYRILEELGQGGFGCVYKAQHTLMDRLAALKVISPDLVEDTRARSWFRREVLATTQLNHPNIVMAYDANEVDDILFLAMEYVEGLNLDQLVRKQGPLPINLACAMMHQVARALQCAHDKGMVHRDIKPANLLIPLGSCAGEGGPSTTPLVKVVDFGLARLHGKGHGNTLQLHKDRSFVGTPDYVSPEQARNIHEVDIRSDLYSLGCTFYFALTGERPFKGRSLLEIVVQHLEKEAEPLEKCRPEVPPALASILRRLMAKKPDHRFQTPDDLVAELSFLFGALSPALPVAPLPAALPPAALGKGVPLTRGNLVPLSTRTPAARPSTAAPDRALLADGSEEELPSTVFVPGALGQPATEGYHSVGGTDAPDTPRLPGGQITDPPTDQQPTPAAEVSADGTTSIQEAATENLASPTVLPLQQAPSPVGTHAGLKEAWQDWIMVVEAFGQGEAPPISDAEYRGLHALLLQRCRAGEGKAGDLLQRLECVVAPWLSLQTLRSTDPQTLASLIQRCRQLERELGVRRSSRNLGFWVAAVLVLLAGGIGGGILLARPAGGRSAFGLDTAWRFLETNPLLALALLLPAMVLASVCVFSRLSRQ